MASLELEIDELHIAPRTKKQYANEGKGINGPTYKWIFIFKKLIDALLSEKNFQHKKANDWN
jgi:hypothetical protein